MAPSRTVLLDFLEGADDLLCGHSHGRRPHEKRLGAMRRFLLGAAAGQGRREMGRMNLLANIGVPMLFVQMPLMIITLPVVILIEAFLCKRWFSLGWGRAFKVTGIANGLSTLLGFPLMWIALVVVQFVVGGGGVPQIPEPWFSIYTVTVQAPWLVPFEDRLYWMIPTACLILLIPAFFLTIFIEGMVYRRSLTSDGNSLSPSAATWRMHFASYAFLFLAGFGMLGAALHEHNSEQSPGDHPLPRFESNNEP